MSREPRSIDEAIEWKAKRKQMCWWCGEDIPRLEYHMMWRAWDDFPNTSARMRVHTECYEVWVNMEEGRDDVGMAEHARGCLCRRGECDCVYIEVEEDDEVE